MKVVHAVPLLVCATLLGCSDSGGVASAPPTGSALARDDYVARLAGWICDDLAACCDRAAQAFDRQACLETYRDKELGRLARVERRGIQGFDERAAAECAALLETTPTDCSGDPRERVRKCFQTYDGFLEVGDPCKFKVECRGSGSGEVACFGGRCAPRADVGEICEGGCDSCRRDARCRESEDGRTRCYAYAGGPGVEGDSCAGPPVWPVDASSMSIEKFRCVYDDGLFCSSETGRCERLLPAGSSCSFGTCERGSFCQDGVCVPGGAAGDSCDGILNCASDLYCRYDIVRCEPASIRNGHCTGFSDSDGHCTSYLAEGQVCQSGIECPDGFDANCVDGMRCREGLRCVEEPDGVERCRVLPDLATRRCASKGQF